MFWDERVGGLSGQPLGSQVDIVYIRTVLITNRVDSRSFSSRYWAFTHSTADPVEQLCVRLALPLTPSLPSGFVPSTKLMVGASPRALVLVKDFSCDCMFWEKRGGVFGRPSRNRYIYLLPPRRMDSILPCLNYLPACYSIKTMELRLGGGIGGRPRGPSTHLSTLGTADK